jgi:hypothetical protein
MLLVRLWNSVSFEANDVALGALRAGLAPRVLELCARPFAVRNG